MERDASEAGTATFELGTISSCDGSYRQVKKACVQKAGLRTWLMFAIQRTIKEEKECKFPNTCVLAL
jgi:hypothetical protein